jgi:hypothetical protein
MEAEIRRQNYPIKHGVKVSSPTGVPFSVEVKKRCPKANALIPTSSRSVVRSTFDRLLLDAARNRDLEHMECEAVPPIKKKNRITGVQIRTATGGLEDLFAGRFLRRGC